MDFAKNLLGKYGWKEGDGLGKHNDGISAALKANYKFDKTGLGHSQADELNNRWWESVFDAAAGNVTVGATASGDVTVTRTAAEAVNISTKNYTIDARAQTHYNGQFLKSSTLFKSAGADSDSDSDEANEALAEMVKINPFRVIADAELFEACEGRTAHKGARHGLKMSGKLARIEAQERELLAKMNASRYASIAPPASVEIVAVEEPWTEVTCGKRAKKAKRKRSEAECTVDGLDLDATEYQSASTKKRKKARKLDAELADALSGLGGAETAELEQSHVEVPAKRKKKTKHGESEPAATVDEQRETKKQRKRRGNGNVDEHKSSSDEPEIEAPAKKKKAKKHHEADATNETPAEEFRKRPATESTEALSDKQLAKAERKRLRQMRRLAKQLESDACITTAVADD